MSFFDILLPLEWAVAWILVGWHSVFTALGLPAANGWTWVLSIIGLVLVIRTLLIPLFVKQIRASRAMQILQPEIKKIQEKYKGRTDPDSRQAMTKEQMDLYKNAKTNPFASCLPILLQMPIFFALFRVLNGISDENFSRGPLDSQLRAQADAATIFGAELSDVFVRAETVSTQIIAAVLVLMMTGSQYWSQRQLMMKNMPPSALEGPFAQQQKILLYVLPGVFAVSGIFFPLGVLIYWLVTNLFSTAQQFVVIQRMPAPGSPAEKALEDRRRRRAERKAVRSGKPLPEPVVEPEKPTTGKSKGKGGASGSGSGQQRPAARSGGAGGSGSTARPGPGRPSGQRSQPKRGSRSKRKR